MKPPARRTGRTLGGARKTTPPPPPPAAELTHEQYAAEQAAGFEQLIDQKRLQPVGNLVQHVDSDVTKVLPCQLSVF